MRRLIFLLLSLSLLFSSPSIAQLPINLAGQGPGGADTAPPGITATTTAPDTVVGITGVTTVPWTFTVTKTPFNFISGDLTLTNCSQSGFSITGLTASVTLTPSSNGAFGASVAASKFQDSRGTDNTASNILTKVFSDVSGFTYNLELATLSVSKHYRGHVATFSDCSDVLGTTHMYGGEMLMCKYNLAATMEASGTSPFNQGIYNFGRLDFGDFLLGSGTVGTGNYTTVDPLNQTNRGGIQTAVGSYKNGVDSYKANLTPLLLYMRNSQYETVGQTLPTLYSTLTDANLISRGVTFRWDYYAPTTGTDYYAGVVPFPGHGTQADGDAKIASYSATVISGTGWYTNFTHWLWWIADYPEHYMSTLNTALGSSDVFRATDNQAIEYYWTKEAADSVKGLGSTVTVYYHKDYPSSPYDKIHTPLWIKLDLTGTGYAGHGITTDDPPNHKIRSMGSNVYYVSVPLDFSNTSTSFHVFVSPSPSYINLNAPIGIRSGNTITIDQPCKKRLYRRPKPTTLTTSVTSMAIPTVDGYTGTISMTGGTGLSGPNVAVGATLRIFNDASHWFYAQIVSYTSGTGVFVLHTSGFQGTGTFSSWTIENYKHYKDVDIVESDLTYSTTFAIGATLDLTNYYYEAAMGNTEQIYSLLEF